MKKWFKGIIYTLACIIAYIVIVGITITITGGSIFDAKLWQTYLIYIIGIVAIAAVFKMYVFSTIFLTGSALGFVYDAMINFQNTSPSMESGMKNIMITLLGCIIAVIAQIILINAKNKIKAQASKKKIKELEAENKKVIEKSQALEKANTYVEPEPVEEPIAENELKVMEIMQPEILMEDIKEEVADADEE